MIYSVAYRSVPTVVGDARTADLRAILSKARAKNATLGITGGLLISDGHFIQVLEGERAVVDGLMATIEHDPRHTDVTVFFREFRDRRRFTDWAMAWIGAGLDGVMALPIADPGAVPAWLELLAERAG